MADGAAWPQALVCVLCPLCGTAERDVQPCPTGPSCGGHTLGDFVCLHADERGDANACAACREAGKDRPCPCNICSCARLDVGRRHPKLWSLNAQQTIRQRAAKSRKSASAAHLLPSVSRTLNTLGVQSRHVQGAVALGLADGRGRGRPIPCQLRDLVTDAWVDENSRPTSQAGMCLRVRAPLVCGRRTARCSGARARACADAGLLGNRPVQAAASAADYWSTAGLGAPQSTPSTAAGPPYGTPPLTAPTRAAAIGDGCDASTAAPTSGDVSPNQIVRDVSRLKDLMPDYERWRTAVLIACDPKHDKYTILRRIVCGLRENTDDMARIVDALVNESR